MSRNPLELASPSASQKVNLSRKKSKVTLFNQSVHCINLVGLYVKSSSEAVEELGKVV